MTMRFLATLGMTDDCHFDWSEMERNGEILVYQKHLIDYIKKKISRLHFVTLEMTK